MSNLIPSGANAPKAPAQPAERRPRARRRRGPPPVPVVPRHEWTPERAVPPGPGRRQYGWMVGAGVNARLPVPAAPPIVPRPPRALEGLRPAAPHGDGRYQLELMAEAYEQLDRNLHAWHHLIRRGPQGPERRLDAHPDVGVMPPVGQALQDLALWHAGHDHHDGFAAPLHPELQVVQALRRQIDFDLLEVVQMHEPEVLGLPPPGAAEELIPRANTSDVHGLHRDRATRHSLARLLTREPRYNAAAHQQQHIAEIGAYLDHHELDGSHFSSSQDPTGMRLLARARQALALRCSDGFSGLLDPANTLVIDALGIDTVPMATVCTVIWDAINGLEACSNIATETAALRLERRDMFVRALASCMVATGHAFCAPGQAQRLAMVLQGCVPEVLIETYSEICSVNQFVAYTLEGLKQHIAHAPSHKPERIRRYLDQSYLEGRAVYQGHKLAQLKEQLQDFVRLTCDIDDWVPPKS